MRTRVHIYYVFVKDFYKSKTVIFYKSMVVQNYVENYSYTQINVEKYVEKYRL